jgi:hypothetical protein
MSHLKFKDFVDLKTYGRDTYSSQKLDKLKGQIPVDVQQFIIKEFKDDETSQTKVMRWILRGLQPDKAIRKVKVDNEVADNARK